jgi:flavin reductase (DIM6/NTAB) family NADH-FMN oxidoreductase RutF
MAKKSFPMSKVYGLLEPGPVVMVTTSRNGTPNIMTMSWHTMIEFVPPLLVASSAIATILSTC